MNIYIYKWCVEKYVWSLFLSSSSFIQSLTRVCVRFGLTAYFPQTRARALAPVQAFKYANGQTTASICSLCIMQMVRPKKKKTKTKTQKWIWINSEWWYYAVCLSVTHNIYLSISMHSDKCWFAQYSGGTKWWIIWCLVCVARWCYIHSRQWPGWLLSEAFFELRIKDIDSIYALILLWIFSYSVFSRTILAKCVDNDQNFVWCINWKFQSIIPKCNHVL